MNELEVVNLGELGLKYSRTAWANVSRVWSGKGKNNIIVLLMMKNSTTTVVHVLNLDHSLKRSVQDVHAVSFNELRAQLIEVSGYIQIASEVPRTLTLLSDSLQHQDYRERTINQGVLPWQSKKQSLTASPLPN